MFFTKGRMMPTQTFFNLPEDKQQRILIAATEEFGKRNVREANLSNIIKDSGISRGSLYQYFLNKDDLYIYVFETLRSDRARYTKPSYVLYKDAPFIQFFETFYLRNSEYLYNHPSHIALGKHLYTYSTDTSRSLIQNLQSQYKELFLIGIEYDKERGLMSLKIDSSVLADLFVHFVTDIFIFQSVSSQLSMSNIHRHCHETLYIIQNGIAPH
ncbi:TetR/AcrR family transcriptional regulator [Lachnospiraceae bacterium ZAX-1]